MSISALDNPSTELVEALVKRQSEKRIVMRTVKGSRNFRMGFGAGFDGFDPDAYTLEGYEKIYPGYADGLRAGRKAGEKL